ncbi:MAG: hypothetical protein Q7U04_05030 [Bacteriovorax sp.]|nr:hypothetical protein [Bacteriovorax sp.]
MGIPPKNIILFEHRPTFKAIYGLNLSLYLGVNVFSAATLKEALEIVKKHPIDFIFIDNSAYSQDTAKKCFFSLDAINKQIQMFIIGPTDLNEEKFHIFDQNTGIRTILQTIAKYLNVTAKDMAELELDAHYAIPLEFVVPGWICPRSIFKRQKDVFEEVLLPDTVVTEEFIDSLINADIEYLYIRSHERLQFVNSLTLQISSLLKDQNLSTEDRIDLTATAHQIVMEQARTLGISESTINLATECIASMNLLVHEIKDLENLLANFLKDNHTYMYKHCFLTNYIGLHLIKKMSWSSKEQQDKFSFICFFHDISLKKDEYVKIHTNLELEALDAPEQDKKLIQNHALVSAKIISAFPKIPFGVDTIIKQHHGSKSGEGLNKIYKDLSPLAVVFILAEEWARLSFESLETEKVLNKAKIVQQLHQKYNTQVFHKILPHLNDLDI